MIDKPGPPIPGAFATALQNAVLERPTVAEVIRLLLTYPQDMPLRIEDADTNWTIEKIHVTVDKDAVWLSGAYSEMTGYGSYNE